MILADTSVWVEHFRHGFPVFAERLAAGQIAIHDVVLGELAAGNLTRRTQTLGWLARLPRIPALSTADCMAFLEQHRLHGHGLGWSDVQLVAAASEAGAAFWTLDKRLATAARRLGL
jgi:hypothetical protein